MARGIGPQYERVALTDNGRVYKEIIRYELVKLGKIEIEIVRIYTINKFRG